MNARDDRFMNRTQMLLRGLYTSGLCVMYQDAELTVHLVENAPDSWPSTETILLGGDQEIFDAPTSTRVIAAKRAVLKDGEPARIEVKVYGPNDTPVWFELDIAPDIGTDEYQTENYRASSTQMIRGLFVSATDITKLKRREDALRALLYEVSHRSRNLLAMLQSILGHTARNSDSIGAFERKFRGRIAALAHSQDLVTTSNWEGVRFRRLAKSQLSEFARPGTLRPILRGNDPLLGPNTALHIGLALHELAANSARFGALATGSHEISIEVKNYDFGQRMTWIEELSVARDLAPYRGFGRTILEQVVARALNGIVEYRIEPERIIYQIDWREPVEA